MVDYVEYPTDWIIALQWGDGDQPPPPPPPPDTEPLANTYGGGFILGLFNGGLITPLQYGPQKPPFTGSFPIPDAPIADGNLSHPYDGGIITVPATLGAAPILVHLGANDLTFTTGQLLDLRDKNGVLAQNGWTVPMAYNGSAVVKTYTISVEWHSNFNGEFGLGMTHPILGQSGTIPKPTEPFINLGSAAAGSASLKYAFRYADWGNGVSFPNTSNQFDPAIGGPAYIWWMGRRATGGGFTAWGCSEVLGDGVPIDIGDFFTWQISSTIEPPFLF